MSYLEKEVFDAEYPTDEALVADDKQWMEEMAKSYGMSVSEQVSQFTYTGNFDEYQANLLPGREYVVWIHGMDEQANSTTPVTKIAFRTKNVDRIANTVTLTAEKTAEGINVTATPDDKITYTNPKEGTEYYIVAAYLDDEAAICSDISQITVNRDGSLSDVTMVKAPAKFLGKTVRRHAK